MWSRTVAPETTIWSPNHFLPAVSAAQSLHTLQKNTVIVDPDVEGDDTDGQENTLVTTDASLLSDSSPTEVRGTLAGTHFLGNADVMRLFTMDITGWPSIPNSVKKNCYYVINNS